MVSKCKESITNGCPLNHKLLSGTPELLEVQTTGAPDCQCSRLLEHRANVHLDLHFIGLCHMGRNSISLSGSSPERPLAELLSDFGTFDDSVGVRLSVKLYTCATSFFSNFFFFLTFIYFLREKGKYK